MGAGRAGARGGYWRTADKVRYQGPAAVLSVWLEHQVGGVVVTDAARASVELRTPEVSGQTNAFGGGMVLPQVLVATPGALLPLTLSTAAFAAAGTALTLEVAATPHAPDVAGLDDPRATRATCGGGRGCKARAADGRADGGGGAWCARGVGAGEFCGGWAGTRAGLWRGASPGCCWGR